MMFRSIRRLSRSHATYVFPLLVLLLPNRVLALDEPNNPVVHNQQVTATPKSEAPYPEFSPHGPFSGPLEFAHIARFAHLPMRMNLEPHLIPPGFVNRLDPRYVPLFERTLREIDDDELLETAATSLARVAKENVQDISGLADILMKHLESHANLRVRFACARALVNADLAQSAAELLKLEEFADDSQRLWIDRALARWKFAPASQLWKKRLGESSETTVSVSLACEGLAALGDMEAKELLLSVLHDKLLAYEKRRAAAKALCVLVPDQSLAEASAFMNGSVLDQLLAIELISTASPDAHQKLTTLCNDASDGVASSAWLALFRLNPDALIPAVSYGRSHRDAVIRMTAARIMRQFPDSERAVWLHELLSDRHLEVRNVAREMSFLVAEEKPALRDEIVAMAGDKLAANIDNWQGIEQCLLLLGQLRATQFSDRCIPLLNHPRNEVLVTSAWLIHLFPDEAVEQGVREYLDRNDAMFKAPATAPAGAYLGDQSAFLIQYAGLRRLKDLQPFLEANLSKDEPGGAKKRAAAMWTLGLFHENDPAPDLVKAFLGRIADRTGMPPETEEVRRLSVVALGLMRAKSAVSGLNEAYKTDPLESVIPDSARWSLGMIGEPLPDALQPATQMIGDWRLSPVDD